jgi:hypothetical protein
MTTRLPKVFWPILAFTLLTPGALAQQPSDRFVIDISKPFAYIKFDHIADRKQPLPNQSPKGLWLRLVNNCRLPIAVRANGPEPGEPGVTIEYDVIPVSISGFPVLGRFPNPSGSSSRPQVQAMPDADTEPPKGYSTEVASVLTIPSGGNLLFSVPLDAVKECQHLERARPFSACWYLQVPFRFLLPKARSPERPKILVDFGWQDLPKRNRENASP